MKNNADVDAPPGVDPDAPDNPATTLDVSTTGNDGNDGHAMPVRTLKRALEIAAADAMITKINVAAGRYNAAGGEVFPYTISRDLTVSGPAGGGAILAGTQNTGLLMSSGSLQDLELENFGIGVSVSGTVGLVGLTFRDSAVSIHGEAGANITSNALSITGVAGACNTGVELLMTARFTTTTFTAAGLGLVVTAKGASNAGLSAVTVTGDPACGMMFDIGTSGTFSISDGMIDGGSNGINFIGATAPTTATLTNTSIRNLTGDALTGRTVAFTMTGGELRNNTRAGLEASGGSWTFTNVAITGSSVMGIYLQGGSTGPGVLKMRGSTVANNGDGIYLFDLAQADLGVPGDPGNNTFQANSGQGLDIDGNSGQRQIDAVANTWRPNVQGADATGKYATTATIAGPVDVGSPSNFSINNGWSLRR